MTDENTPRRPFHYASLISFNPEATRPNAGPRRSTNEVPRVLPLKQKSSAQVDSFVGQQAVRQNLCGLKPGLGRPHRLVTRVSEPEREIVLAQAARARLSLSDFMRLSLLREPFLDPARNRLLMKAKYELSKQGLNLNQIAKQLHHIGMSPEDAADILEDFRSSLTEAHETLREAVLNGWTIEEI